MRTDDQRLGTSHDPRANGVAAAIDSPKPGEPPAIHPRSEPVVIAAWGRTKTDLVYALGAAKAEAYDRGLIVLDDVGTVDGPASAAARGPFKVPVAADPRIQKQGYGWAWEIYDVRHGQQPD